MRRFHAKICLPKQRATVSDFTPINDIIPPFTLLKYDHQVKYLNFICLIDPSVLWQAKGEGEESNPISIELSSS